MKEMSHRLTEKFQAVPTSLRAIGGRRVWHRMGSETPHHQAAHLVGFAGLLRVFFGLGTIGGRGGANDYEVVGGVDSG